MGDGAERDVHERSRRLEGAGHRQLLVAHWFDAKDGIAAVGWYEQGVRFLDYRRPAEITQVGYYIPANGSTWAAYWSPTDPAGEIVYTADAYRGVDVLRIDGGGRLGKKVKAPVRDEWIGGAAADAASFQPHPQYGFMCPPAEGRRRPAFEREEP